MAFEGRLALVAFLGALVVYLASGSAVPDSHDTTSNAFVPVGLLNYGDFAFSPLEAPLMFAWGTKSPQGLRPINVASWTQIEPASGISLGELHREGKLVYIGPRYYVVPTTQVRASTGAPLFVGIFGAAAGLTALPAAVIAQAAGMDLRQDPFAMFRVANWTAGILTAGSVALVFLSAVAFTSPRRAFLLAAAYGFGSCVWSISSHGLWQQTPALFFLSLGVFCLVRCDPGRVRGAAAGAAFAAAAACRPTGAIIALAAGVYLAIADRRALVTYLGAAIPIGVAVMAYNAHYLGSVFELGHFVAGPVIAKWKTGSAEIWQTPVWLGAAGLLLSPSRGLLVYSPFFAAAFIGALLAWQDRRYAPLRFLTIAVPAIWLPAFVYFDWWGGWSYGYRTIVDSTPLLALLCIPALDRLLARPAWKAVFLAAVAWSVFVQVLGALAYAPEAWNARPIAGTGIAADIDHPEHRARLWSFRDWQIGYLIANFETKRAR